jgi:hypothetical protein
MVRATGEILTVFLKGCHPLAAEGGATLSDDVRVVDLRPWTWQAVSQVVRFLFVPKSSGSSISVAHCAHQYKNPLRL